MPRSMPIPPGTRGCFTPGPPRNWTKCLVRKMPGSPNDGSTSSLKATSKGARFWPPHEPPMSPIAWGSAKERSWNLSLASSGDCSRSGSSVSARVEIESNHRLEWTLLRAFADGSRISGRDDFRDVAENNAEFILEYFSATAAFSAAGRTAMLASAAFSRTMLSSSTDCSLCTGRPRRPMVGRVDSSRGPHGGGFWRPGRSRLMTRAPAMRHPWHDREISTTARRRRVTRWQRTCSKDWAQ